MNKSKFADGSSLVITKNEDGVIACVTRQDAEGEILEVLGESDFVRGGVLDEWKLVPKTPTDEMLSAALRASFSVNKWLVYPGRSISEPIYAAMLAAAPQLEVQRP